MKNKGYATLGEIAEDICKKKGLELETSSFLNSDKKIYVYDDQIKARKYMSYISEKAGGFCCASRTGKIQIKKIGEDEVIIPQRLFKNYKWSEEHQITRVAYENGTESFKIGDETKDTLWIRQDNLFINEEDDIRKIYDAIKNLNFYSFEGTTIISPIVDIGDIINIDGKKIIYQGEMTLNKRFIADIKSKIAIKQKQDTTTRKQNQKVINRKLQSQIDEENLKLTQLAQETSENSEKITKHEQTIDSMKDTLKSQETKIETVENKADAAQSTADTATTKANNAQTSANNAQNTANTANTNAQNAQKIANDNTSKITTNTTKIAEVEKTVSGITQSVSEVKTEIKTVDGKADKAQSTANTAKSTVDSTNKNLSNNYYTKTETNSQITQKAESITSEVSKTYSTKTETSTAKTEAINSANSSTDNKLKGYTETSKLGTAIEQNYEHVKVAWNQISDFIQMMIINKNASLAILDKDKNVMMALDKEGQHFYKNDGTEFGEMGVQTVDKQNYISFSVPINYNSSVSDGMAWGVKNKKTNKFLPILYIKNFEQGSENSDELSGELVLSACNLVLEGIGTGIKTGSIFISGDSTSGNLTFFDTNSNTTLMTVCPSNVIDYPMIYILDNIQFYKNQNGSCSFRIGMGDKHCLLTDEGDFSCNHIYCDGDIYATGYVNGKKFIDNSREEMKKNIQKYTEKAIEVVKNTDIYKFNYKTEKDTNKKCVGFIIGEDYKYSKELTSTDENGKEIGANLYSMISIAYKAIQEQQEQIEELQAKDKQKDELIQSLIQRIETLEKEVNK